jgi:conjugative relaxase-like TrwC/TraI family protein
MLTIHEVTSATNAKAYYAAADYYSQGQETVGQWGGKLAERLGQSGKVTKEAFDRMVDNLDPATGRQLTPRMREDRRVGYDFTVSVPKSVSVVRAFAGEQDARALDAARDRAIAGMMAEIEADMQTRGVRPVNPVFSAAAPFSMME